MGRRSRRQQRRRPSKQRHTNADSGSKRSGSEVEGIVALSSEQQDMNMYNAVDTNNDAAAVPLQLHIDASSIPSVRPMDETAEPETDLPSARNHEGEEETANEQDPTSSSSSSNSFDDTAETLTIDSIGKVHGGADEASSPTFMLSPIAPLQNLQMNRNLGDPVGMAITNEHETASKSPMHSETTKPHSTAIVELEAENIEKSLPEQKEELVYDDVVVDEDDDDDEKHYNLQTATLGGFRKFLSPCLEESFDDLEIDEREDDDEASQVEDEARGVRADLNSSSASSGSTRDEEIARTREELGVTSLAFLHRLRGAAFRRKKRLVNSRDDMVAKERIHREGIEAARLQRRLSDSPEPGRLQATTAIPEPVLDEYRFKARPAPNLQFMGAVGVPKVDKRPVTIPMSPLLGLRRQVKPPEYPSQAPAVASTGFSALPLPKTTGEKGHGGQSGLPVIAKRPVTVPFSPLLGMRRENNDQPLRATAIPKHTQSSTTSGFKALPVPKCLKAPGLSGVPRIPSRPTTVPWSPLLGFRRRNQAPPNEPAESRHQERDNDASHIFASHSTGTASSPLGVSVLHSTPVKENEPPTSPAVKLHHPGYEPHSTVRAKKRADFDAYNAARERARLEQERQARLMQSRTLKKELSELRQQL